MRLPASDASRRLATHAWGEVLKELGPDPRSAHRELTADEFFRRAGKLRSQLYQSAVCRDPIGQLLRQVGCDPANHVCDPVRLRVVAEGGHLNPAAAPVYYAHRDTWYSNAQEQITWWMPLHAVTLKETFEFLPDCFSQAVVNDSESFDYDRWTRKGTSLKIGWQDPDAGKREIYPQLRESLDGQTRVGFEAEAGEVLVFCGQHLHQTVPITDGPTRFSIDFRTVCLPDRAKCLGPPNVDNRSTGDAIDGHVPVLESHV